MKLLLVEDEEDLSALLVKGLRKKGYAVDPVFDGEEALFAYEINEYDLIILDLNLPKMDGLEVLKQVRSQDSLTKILILSARSKIEERVCGLDSGANDYLIKPFDFLELEARVRTLLRMHYTQHPTVLACGQLKIDTASRQAALQNKPLALTKKEYALLEYLALHQGQVISAETLIEHVWDSEVDLFSNSLKFHIHSLKKKLELADASHEYIQNLRGQGYVLTEGQQ